MSKNHQLKGHWSSKGFEGLGNAALLRMPTDPGIGARPGSRVRDNTQPYNRKHQGIPGRKTDDSIQFPLSSRSTPPTPPISDPRLFGAAWVPCSVGEATFVAARAPSRGEVVPAHRSRPWIDGWPVCWRHEWPTDGVQYGIAVGLTNK